MIHVIRTKDGNRLMREDISIGRVKFLSENHPDGIPGDHFIFCKANPPGEDFLEFSGDKPKIGLCLAAYVYVNGKPKITYISDEIVEVY